MKGNAAMPKMGNSPCDENCYLRDSPMRARMRPQRRPTNAGAGRVACKKPPDLSVAVVQVGVVCFGYAACCFKQ